MGIYVVVPGGAALIEHYYRIAPVLVRRVQARPDAGCIWESVFRRLEEVAFLILDSQRDEAITAYIRLVQDLDELDAVPESLKKISSAVPSLKEPIL